MRAAAATLALAVSFLQQPAFPQTQAPQQRLPIMVKQTGEDPIGIDLAHQIRERLASSHIYRLADDVSDTSYLVINVMSIDEQRTSANGISSAVGVTFALHTPHVGLGGPYDYLVNQQIHALGKDRTADVASKIVALLDRYVS